MYPSVHGQVSPADWMQHTAPALNESVRAAGKIIMALALGDKKDCG
jgi:hypothetical protein